MPRLSGGSNNGSYLYVDYTIGAQDVVANTTSVSWTVGVHWGTYYFNIHDALVAMTNAYGTVSGTTTTGTYNSGWPISGAGPNRDHDFKSGTTIVHHNTSGLGNIKFAGQASWDTPSDFTSHISATVALPTILAGAHVRVAGVWKTAIPYVRVSGVWKRALPMVRSSGVWKNTN